ncbi:MAG: helix-turn-helix domain-containing protein [Oceanicoccus sp.]
MIKYLAFESYIYDYLEDRGITSDGIKSRIRRQAKGRHERLQMLANFAIDQSGESRLGLIIGQRITNTAFGILGHALINCSSLLESQRFLLKHIWVWQEHPINAVSLHLDRDHLYLNYNYPTRWPRNENFLVDLFFSSNLKRSRELIEGDIKGAFLELKRQDPGEKKHYERLLKIPVSFGQNEDRLVFPRKTAEAPLSSSFLIHSKGYQRHCENLLRQMQSASGITEHIRLAVVHSGKTKLKEPQMAEKMNISVRTLRRRLNSEGTSYRQIQQQIQSHLARSYLSDTELSVADIASLVGYFDTPTFSRAFKSWTGYTPPQFRKKATTI